MSLDIYLYFKIDTGCHIETIEVGESLNATHNLGPMWKAAGCYDALYESHGKEGSTQLATLKCALDTMQKNPDKFCELNPPNGWGSYADAIQFLGRLISQIELRPKAKIGVYR